MPIRTAQSNNNKATTHSCQLFIIKQTSYLINCERHQPGQRSSIKPRKHGPLPTARLPFNGCQRGDARKINQHKHHVTESHQGRYRNAFTQAYGICLGIVGIKHSERAYHQFLRPTPERMPMPSFQSNPNGSMTGSMALPIRPM